MSTHSFLSHFLIGFQGTDLPEDVSGLLSEGLAGVVLFRRNIESADQVRELTAKIRGVGGDDRIIAVDQEGGRVQRLKGIGTTIPAAAVVAGLGGDAVTITGTIMACELAGLGFNTVFAPVMDVYMDTGDPVIGDRSFSADPFVCAGLGARVISAMNDSGIMACPKHFPGHGAANADSHKHLPLVDADYDTMSRRELVPFRGAVRNGARMIMTAHCLYSSLDSQNPASLSNRILNGLLRRSIGFDGVIVSDDLEMKAIADRYSLGETLDLGVKAGIDLFMYCSNPESAVKGAEILSGLYNDDRMLLMLNNSYNRLQAVHEWIRSNAGQRKKWMGMDFEKLVLMGQNDLVHYGINND